MRATPMILVMIFAFGARASTASRLPMWSASSCVIHIHWISLGSIIDSNALMYSSASMPIPVSTSTGC